MADEENNEKPADKIEKIIKHLKGLKSSRIAPHFQDPYELEEEEEKEEVLKEVYDKRGAQMLKIPDHKSSLQEVFMGSDSFNCELVNADPLPIIILILACDDVPEKFEKFLLSKEHLTSRDISLILSYLCQVEFDRSKLKLLRLLQQSPQMKAVMEIFEDSSPPKLLGYYDLKAEQVSKIAEPNVTEQIRLRVLCEQKGEYSVAFNHLLNEIQSICYVLDNKAKDPEEYKANEVAAFLRNQKVPHETHAQIRNLFDRRNKSPVSHADPIAWTVTKDEYINYRSHVGNCLKHLEPIIEKFQHPAWAKAKQRYKKKLEAIPCIQKGYIKIDGNNAKVVIVLAEESVGIIKQLAEIDREMNLKFRPLYFFVEYEPSEDYFELDGFECFYP